MPRRSARRLRIEALRVRESCEARGWSAEDLSHGAWISPDTARNLFNGRSVDPTISNAIPVARALGTYIEDLAVLAPDATLPGTDVPRSPRPPQLQNGAFKIKRLLIRERCEELGWSLDDLSRTSGVNFHTLRGLFYGFYTDATVSTMLPIARAMGNHIEELVEVEETDAVKLSPPGSELITA